MNGEAIHVVKLGGSLLDLWDLRERFAQWQAAQGGGRFALVVGGGAAADVVREFDKAFALDPERAHWLAIRAMQFNMRLVEAVLEGCKVVAIPQACVESWGEGKTTLVDPWEWLSAEAAAGVHIPHRWSFTSDSIAAHVATRLGAAKLTLLKSTLPPGGCGVRGAAGLGIVDEDFAEASRSVPAIELVNLRSTPVGRCVLR